MFAVQPRLLQKSLVVGSTKSVRSDNVSYHFVFTKAARTLGVLHRLTLSVRVFHRLAPFMHQEKRTTVRPETFLN